MDRDRAQALLSQICGVVQAGDASKEVLAQAATRLVVAAEQIRQWQTVLRNARPGEELCYELGVDTKTGIALYLVSDGPGSVSPPHEHQTWAVIAGGCGCERNRIYRRVAATSRQVVEVQNVVIGNGDTLILSPESIHSTEVVGAEPTYHLHMYGKPLASLPPLTSRTFELTCDV